jgi:hypothetical protein
VYAEPTEEEVEEYAVYLGIDPSYEKDLLWIARQVNDHDSDRSATLRFILAMTAGSTAALLVVVDL